MTTKQEYIDVLGQMEELYYNSDNCTLAMNLFKEDINLLTGLVNECFEPKQETNIDHYKDDIAELFIDKLALVDGKPKRCKCVTICDTCDLYEKCNEHKAQEELRKRFKQPYKKPTYKLNQFEYDLLKSYSDIYSFNAFNSLSGMKEKGYFKGIDDNKTIGDILDNCEVIK